MIKIHIIPPLSPTPADERTTSGTGYRKYLTRFFGKDNKILHSSMMEKRECFAGTERKKA
jgi:hypothetical protein